jgi:hypothetical protein
MAIAPVRNPPHFFHPSIGQALMRYARFFSFFTLSLMLVACGGGGGGGGGGGSTPTAPTFSLDTITISGTTDTICTVSAEGVADGDAIADTAWTVALDLDDIDLPEYVPGSTYDTSLTISAEDTEARTTTYDIGIRIDP